MIFILEHAFVQEPQPSAADYSERWHLDVSGSYSSIRCLECDMTFDCVKERRIHVQTVHKTPQHTQVKTEGKSRHYLKKAEIVKVKQEKLNIKSETNARTCVECGLELQSIKQLKKHKKSFHDKRKCGTCDMVFNDSVTQKDHIAKVHPIECNVCGKLFTTRTAANAHSKNHLKLKPFKCTVCDKSFVSRMKLNDHNNIHSGEAPYKCPMCNLSFKRQSNLIQHKNSLHLKVKRKIKDYFCRDCGEIFHSIKKLQWHKEIHDPKPKQCMYCSERYVHSTSLTRHIRHAHDSTYLPKPTTSLNSQCPVCKITCIKTSLAQHMKLHTGDRPFQCNVCSKDFSTNWNLQMHKWTHASRNTKPFKCNQCKCAFYILSSYQAHMRSHRNIRPYTCNYCGRQFIRKYNCVRHVKEHETKKSYCCAVCNRTFHRSYYLTEHMRTHTGVKPYTCHICSKTSTTKSNHNKHVRTHHAREPVNTEG